MATPGPQTVAQRYVLHELLGRGGMGAVYRATDRLRGAEIALKQVTVPGGWRRANKRAGESDLALALAQEFKALATLHHPNIIQVFDFGFDTGGQPYFTMEYIADGQDILLAGRALATADKARLLLQMLEALKYLHRRGIIHRDLKPANVLVEDGRVRLVDFGLSVVTERTVEHRTQSTVGTLAYMAPELFQGRPYSRASDLYAVGLIALELLGGHFPYTRANLAVLLNEILNLKVDPAAILGDGPLATVLEPLLAKHPDDRPARAAEVMTGLRRAAGLPEAPETEPVRESFLQSARFVGRTPELASLVERLNGAAHGRGALVLVAGESGVGKSRLLDELRTRALVKGFVAVRGQAVREGRRPYHVWRNILRALTLQGHPDDAAAAVLRPIVPDLEALIGRTVARQEEPGIQSAEGVLHTAVRRLFDSLERPVLVILEDLHAAGKESLDLLEALATWVDDRSVMLAATYRIDGPTPQLERFAATDRLTLDRLPPEAVGQLVQSMLGHPGQDKRLVNFIASESEGNVFFVVEAVRALTALAGGMATVGAIELPDRIATAGIQRLLRARLERLPAAIVPLLQLAAVQGRRLDEAVLQQLHSEIPLDAWLTACTDYAIIEPDGAGWRFTHDKLREIILASVAAAQLQDCHRRVAEALECAYPDAAGQAAALAHHWAAAGDQERERRYATLAGHEALANSVYAQAVAYFERAVALLPAESELAKRDEDELALRTALGTAYIVEKGFAAPEVQANYARAQQLAAALGRSKALFQAIWGQWQYYVHEIDLDKATMLQKQLSQLAEDSADEDLLLETYHVGWSTAFAVGDTAAMRRYVQLGQGLYDRQRHAQHKIDFGHDPGVCSHFTGGLSWWLMGYPDRALATVNAGFSLATEIGHSFSTGLILWGRVVIARLRGDRDLALTWAAELAQFAQEHSLNIMGHLADYMQALTHTAAKPDQAAVQSLYETAKLILDNRGFSLRSWFLSETISVLVGADLLDEAEVILSWGLQDPSLVSKRIFSPEWRRVRGELLLARQLGSEAEAEAAFREAIVMAERQHAPALVLRATTSLARLKHSQGQTATARRLLQTEFDHFREGFDTADLRRAAALLAALA